MKRLWLIIIASVALCWINASATIINIPLDYPIIQAGIDASSDGDTVLVQPETYVENINFNGHNIVLGSLFLTTGDTSYISATIIDGDSSGTVVTFGNGEDSTAIITGFTIQNGFTSGWRQGGGIHCDNNSNPQIINNIITDNSTVSGGGGIHCDNNNNAQIINNIIADNSTVSGGGGIYCGHFSSPLILNNNIFGNSANTGGGIFCYISSPIIKNNIIKSNDVNSSGGGITCSLGSSPSIDNNTIIENFSENGGGIYCDYFSSPNITFNIINRNSANLGGGIYCANITNAAIYNTILSENSANTGGGIYCIEYSDMNILNAIIWFNSAQYYPEIFVDSISLPIVRYSDIQGGWPGEGNIDVNPLFRDPDNGDFHLMSINCGDSLDSPCMDAGDPNILDSLLDCSWGLGGLRSDMGAYGGGDSALVGILENLSPLPYQYILFQNYPNPFNAQTTIKFTLPDEAEVTLTVYDLLGRKVAILFEGLKESGVHSIIWNADDVPSGLYFARLETQDRVRNMKMVLLK